MQVKYVGKHEDGVVLIVNGSEIDAPKGEPVEVPDDVGKDLTTNQAVNWERASRKKED